MNWLQVHHSHSFLGSGRALLSRLPADSHLSYMELSSVGDWQSSPVCNTQFRLFSHLPALLDKYLWSICCRLSTGPGGQGTRDHRDLNSQPLPANREGTKITSGQGWMGLTRLLPRTWLCSWHRPLNPLCSQFFNLLKENNVPFRNHEGRRGSKSSWIIGE